MITLYRRHDRVGDRAKKIHEGPVDKIPMISKAWRALMHQRIRKREQPLPIENSSSNVFCNNCCENERLQGKKESYTSLRWENIYRDEYR